ncbi:sortase [Candidatus Daviesbacteria bacterium]|nr:sortase [Candidatus Daviesbacteria bacterium]
MSNRFKLVLLIRFLGHLIFFAGLIGFIFMFGPLLSAETKYQIDKVKGVKRTVPDTVITSQSNTAKSEEANFESLSVSSETSIIPVSTEYGIVIEKINANAKIVAGVNPAIEKEYVKALSQGVAEALGSTPPGQPGNLYLFSHSTDAPWNIVRFNAVFYLLRELEAGDRVIVFYQNKRFDYVVFDKRVVEPNDVSYLTNRYDNPVITLQTCDPPGTLLKRLIVRAKLVSG